MPFDCPSSCSLLSITFFKFVRDREVNKNWPRFKGCIVFRALSAYFGLKIDGKLYFEKFSVATKFNSFYTAIASKLIERLSKNVNKFGDNFDSGFYRIKCVISNSYTLVRCV